MSTQTSNGEFRETPTNGGHEYERPDSPDGPVDHSLLAEDPLTGLPWTETLLPLITNWAGTAIVHAICLHFVGLGILANIPEYQSSHSLLREATDRLTPLMEDGDRLTRFSGNKLLIFSKRTEPAIRHLVVEIADRMETFGTDVDGRHLPEIRVGIAMLGGRGRTTITVEAMNALMTDAAGVTVPMAEVVTPKGAEIRPDAAAEVFAAVTPSAPTTTPARNATPPRETVPPTLVDEPEIPDQTPERIEEMETTMITRGHPERIPIRPAPESPASAAGLRGAAVSEHRLILRSVDVVVTGLVATAVVDLDFSGQRVRGKAIGRSSDTHHLGLVGEALARAVTDLLPAGHGAVFRQAVPTATDAGEVLVTVIEFLTPDRTEFLYGVAPTDGEPVAGVAKSVLNAVNHPTATLLEFAG